MALGTELEQGGLSAWSRAQQAALYHGHLAEQHERDEKKAEKDEKEKKDKKKKDKNVPKLDQITAESVVARILHHWCPALFEFLDMFGPPHMVLPIFIILHVFYWMTAPWYLSLLLPLPLTHLLPISLSLKSLYSPSWALERAYDEAKRKWDKECSDLAKKGKEKADFPDPPDIPPGWQVSVRDRKNWLAYWVFVGGVEYLELLCFGDNASGLMWWPRLKAVFFISLYCIWEEDETGHQTTGAMKFVVKFLPEPRLDKKEKEKQAAREKQKAEAKEKKEKKQAEG